MQPVQRPTFLIINPSGVAEPANLAFGVRQDAGVQPGARPTTPRAEGVTERQAGESGADVHPATHAAARATLQAQLPPVPRQRLVVTHPLRRTMAAVSMIGTGGVSAGVSLGLLVHTIASHAIDTARTQHNASYFPEAPATNQSVVPIATAIATASLASGLILGGVSLLWIPRTATNTDAQIQLPRRARQRQHVAVPLQEIVIEPNTVESSAPAAAAAPTVAQANDKPDSPRWDAAAASALLPFADDHG